MAALLKRRRDLGWVPTVVVLAVVLIAGSRLMYLSVQHHAAAARAEATTILAAYAGKIDPELQKLGVLASRQGAAAGKALANTNTFTSLDSVPLVSNAFWMTNEDRVLSALPADANAAAGIASEWDSAESARPVPGATVLGPLRLGSQWLVAARVPVVAAIPGVESQSRGWAVSYGDLDEMISGAHLARLTDSGYDFELSQVEPRSARTRIFVSSSTEPLQDAVAIKLRLPNGFQPATAGSYLQVAILPRTGWYPATELASDIGLLAFLAWLLAFGTHDLSHALKRSRSALTAARARLRNINKQLATEMQQRLSLQETFDHARFHDAFTGLPNRRYFMDQLDRALRDVRTKRRQRVAVIIVDISRFKLVNDMLGHTAGDELMVQAARRFEKSTSAVEGVLARWGGDQFAVLILDVASTDSALGVAGVLQDELRAPFELRRHKLVVTATIGVTTVDSGQQRAEDVVREADLTAPTGNRNRGPRVTLLHAQTWDRVRLTLDMGARCQHRGGRLTERKAHQPVHAGLENVELARQQAGPQVGSHRIGIRHGGLEMRIPQVRHTELGKVSGHGVHKKTGDPPTGPRADGNKYRPGPPLQCDSSERGRRCCRRPRALRRRCCNADSLGPCCRRRSGSRTSNASSPVPGAQQPRQPGRQR